MQVGTTFTRNAVTNPAQNLITLLAAASPQVIKQDLDLTNQSPAVLQQYSAAEFLADLTDATIIGIVSGASQPDVNAGITANAAKNAIVAAIPTADIVNNISVVTQENVVASMTAAHIIVGVNSAGATVQNGVVAGLYSPIDNTKNVIKISATSTTGTVTTNAKWQVATWSFSGVIFSQVASATVNGVGIGAPNASGIPFTTGTSQVIVITLAVPLLTDCYITLNGFILQ